MLVLSRKKNESIVINNDITIVVVEIRGDKVRLGIDAPQEIPVHRVGLAAVGAAPRAGDQVGLAHVGGEIGHGVSSEKMYWVCCL